MGAKAKHDVAPTIRGAFMKAIGIIEKDKGLTLPQMMAKAIESDGLLAVLDRLSKFTVRESKFEGDLNVSSLADLVRAAHDPDAAGVVEESDTLRH